MRGLLVAVEDDHACLEIGGIAFDIMISGAVAERLVMSGAVGTEVEFFTFSYIEGGVGMGHLVPRLVGFTNRTDLEFFHLLTTVQGLSVKKSLKALSIPVKEVSRAIELNNLTVLKGLPEVGPKTAQKIIVELKGKVAKFALLREEEITGTTAGLAAGEEFIAEAMAILQQLQYSEIDADSLIRKTLQRHPDIVSAEDLIQEIFRNQVGR